MTVDRFVGHVAVVVGGTSGVGLAVAKGFARGGARVAILGRPSEAAQAAADEVEAGGGAASFIAMDATDEVSTREAVGQVARRFGAPSILYNNVGKVIVKRFEDTTFGDWNDLWTINVVTMINSVKAVLPSMLERGRGAIVNMASISSLTASAFESAYCTTKGACVQLTRAIAVEYRDRGIRCNAICPGFIKTGHGLGELSSFAALGMPMTDADLAALQGRIAAPDEIAEAALFLASDAASFVNGECLVVDNAAMAKT